MEFENKGIGRCIVLKESNTSYSLIYSITAQQFVVVSNLDLKTGNWLHGTYFNKDIDKALFYFNERTRDLKYER